MGDGMLCQALEHIETLLCVLSINESQLAKMFCVEEPILRTWLTGAEPNPRHKKRLDVLLSLLDQASISKVTRLNARFVRKAWEADSLSLLELLSAKHLNKKRIVQALKQVQVLGEIAFKKRENRNCYLCDLGFEELTDCERREQLARNIALMG